MRIAADAADELAAIASARGLTVNGVTRVAIGIGIAGLTGRRDAELQKDVARLTAEFRASDKHTFGPVGVAG